MNEKAVKEAVKKYLTSIGAYFFMPVQTGYGATTLDFLVCYQGEFYGIETKRPGHTAGATVRQKEVMKSIEEAWGRTCVETSTDCEAVKEMLR